MKFFKRRKRREKITISPISFDRDPVEYPISFVPENMRDGFDYEKDFNERQKIEAEKVKKNAQSPLEFEGITRPRK